MPTKKSRDIAAEVAAARSALANVCRHNPDPDAITAAREHLARVKAERLREDLDALAAGVVDPNRARITSHASGSEMEPISREMHNAVEQAAYDEAVRFKKDHGPTSEWDSKTFDKWNLMLARYTEVHQRLGCSRNSYCRMKRGH